jgi:hypothetical protein
VRNDIVGKWNYLSRLVQVDLLLTKDQRVSGDIRRSWRDELFVTHVEIGCIPSHCLGDTAYGEDKVVQ